MGVFRFTGLDLLVICFLCIVLCKGQAVQRSSFGEYCNDTVKCDKSSWLKCQSSSCACLMDDMTFDKTRNKCVSKPGERCKFQISETASDNNGMVLFESTECVVNAHCNNGFICSCDVGYYETVEGNCVERKDVNTSCTSSAECKNSKFLFCIQGQCLCAAEHQHIYARSTNDSTEFMCVTKAGKSLSGGTPCVEGAQMQNGICVCDDPDHNYASPDGYCHQKKSHGETCSMDEECQFVNTYLMCVNGKCGCDTNKSIYQTFQKPRTVITHEEIEVIRSDYRDAGRDTNGQRMYYQDYHSDTKFKGEWLRQTSYRCPSSCYYYGMINATIETVVTDTLSQCVGLARLPCNPESNCIKNSGCMDDICTCVDHFSPTSTGSCGIGYGRTCSKSTPCSDSFQCTNNICDCPQVKHQIYNSLSQKCVGVVASFCNDDSDCTKNTVCRKVSETGKKQCICAEGFVENMNGRCDKAWNTPCDEDDDTPCDTVAELKCRNGLCACVDTLTNYDADYRKCLGIVGARCYEDKEMIMSFSNNVTECSVGAHCVQMNSNTKVAGRCLCQKNFEAKDDMLCHKVEEVVSKFNEMESHLEPVGTNKLEIEEVPVEMEIDTSEVVDN